MNLYLLLKVPLLREAFYSLKRSASAGLDGEGWYEYERQLESRLPELQDELHKGSYRAIPAKRTYLEKPDGRKRPLGVQAAEDKMVQMACLMILNNVFEPTFTGFSYGSRPGRGAHDALDMGEVLPTASPLASKTQTQPSVSKSEIRRQILKVGAVCGSTARTYLCGEGLRKSLRKSFYRNNFPSF